MTADHWYDRLKSAPDRYAFVLQAAKVAHDGDGRAALYVGNAVMDCLVYITLAARGVDIGADHQRELEQIPQNGNPDWIAELKSRQYERCKRLATADAFVGLPPRKGGYADPRYWWNLAKDLKDPGAMGRDTIEKLANASFGVGPPISAEDGQAAIDQAVLSGDPMAMFSIGFGLSDGHLSNNTDRGMAIALAACDLGYDCSWDNPAMQAEACKYNDSCSGATDYPSRLRTTLSPERFAKVYAESRELEMYLENRSTSDVLAFVKIYRSATKAQVTTR